MIIGTQKEIFLVFVFAVFMACTFGFGLDLISALVPDIKEEFLLTTDEVGWVTGIGRLGFVLGSILAGLFASMLSPALLVVLAVAGCSLAWLVLGNADSPIVATVAIFMSSAFTALSWVPMTGVFALFVSENNRATAFGTIIAGAGIGTSLAGYLSPFFITNYSWRMALVVASIFTWLVILIGLISIKHSGILNNRETIDNITFNFHIKTVLRHMDGRLFGIMGIFFLVGYSVHPFQIFLSTYLRNELEQTATVAGNAWLTIGLVGTWSGLLMGYLADKFGIRQIMLLACFFLILSVVILTNMHAPMWFIISAFVFSLSYNCMPGLLPAFLSVRYPPNVSIRMFSAGSMMLGIGVVIGSIVGGEISNYFQTLEAYYWTCVVAAVLIGLLTLIFMDDQRQDGQDGVVFPSKK